MNAELAATIVFLLRSPEASRNLLVESTWVGGPVPSDLCSTSSRPADADASFKLFGVTSGSIATIYVSDRKEGLGHSVG
jgi:hypothetical protein